MLTVIAGVVARGFFKNLLFYVGEAIIEGVAQGVSNIVAWRVEDAHDRIFKVGDHKPEDDDLPVIEFVLEEPCAPGCQCEACVEAPPAPCECCGEVHDADAEEAAADATEGGEDDDS